MGCGDPSETLWEEPTEENKARREAQCTFYPWAQHGRSWVNPPSTSSFPGKLQGNPIEVSGGDPSQPWNQMGLPQPCCVTSRMEVAFGWDPEPSGPLNTTSVLTAALDTWINGSSLGKSQGTSQAYWSSLKESPGTGEGEICWVQLAWIS